MAFKWSLFKNWTIFLRKNTLPTPASHNLWISFVKEIAHTAICKIFALLKHIFFKGLQKIEFDNNRIKSIGVKFGNSLAKGHWNLEIALFLLLLFNYILKFCIFCFYSRGIHKLSMFIECWGFLTPPFVDKFT